MFFIRIDASIVELFENAHIAGVADPNKMNTPFAHINSTADDRKICNKLYIISFS